MILVFLGILSIIMAYFVIMKNVLLLVYIFMMFIGVFLAPIVPLMLELGCELVYPLSGSFAIGTLYAGATLFSAFTA